MALLTPDNITILYNVVNDFRIVILPVGLQRVSYKLNYDEYYAIITMI